MMMKSLRLLKIQAIYKIIQNKLKKMNLLSQNKKILIISKVLR